MTAYNVGKNAIKRLIRRPNCIQEWPKINVSFDVKAAEPRLNLVLLSGQASTGGAHTALRFFEALCHYYPRSRIVILLEDERDFKANQWLGRELESRAPGGPHTIAYLAKQNFRPTIGIHYDHFIATHWRTASYVISLREAQAACCHTPRFPFIYLIQDFEPGFYPWSANYLLASATYTMPKETVAVFNTGLLKEYTEKMGFVFPVSYAFEPKLNPILATYKNELVGRKKRRLILFYGRPGAARNAFELAIEALRTFAEQYENAEAWQALSVGQSHDNIRLSRKLVLRAQGKISLKRYAELLLDASVGLSLMVSPHPSYPPLEMAEFGLRVITNSFANKDLSLRTSNIVSLFDTRPAAFAAALIDACKAHEAGIMVNDSRPAFLGCDDEFTFGGELVERLFDHSI